MLPKLHRLSKQDFAILLKTGRRVHGAHISYVYCPAPEGKPFACGVVVSKKVAKSAVARNLLTRRIYNILGAHAVQCAGKYSAIMTRSGTAELSFEELEKETVDVLKRI